jgi:hypothetical protein
MKATSVACVTVTLLCLALGSAVAEPNHNPGIVPIGAHANGKTYGELAAAWWKWVLETPAPEAAILDPTGEKCASRQTGHVWFLAGSLFGEPVNRTCTVPRGTFLFFPMANALYGAFVTEPDSMRTEAFVRAQTVCVEGAEVHAFIDGVLVGAPQQYLEQSWLFVTHFPENNVFGVTADDVPDLTLDPTVDRGYYLYLNPLPPGPHTIRFTAAATSPDNCVSPQDATYHLTIAN